MQQQQHVAVASSSGLSTAIPTVELTTVTVVDRLKLQLLQAYDNGDTEQATDVIIKLEKSNLTKELLEMTRVGAVVNNIRKKVAQSAPELSKRCRALIKCWQKLAEPKPASSDSSANCTPSYASPIVKKGITPSTCARGPRVIHGGNSCPTPAGNSRLTPLNSSVLTPSGSSGSQSTAVSPTVSNGRAVAPHQRSGQEVHANAVECETIRKSNTVGADLAMKAVQSSLLLDGIIRNGKRKSENIMTSNMGITNGLSDAKRLRYCSVSVSPTTPHQSLLAARRADVKSTSELVAQLTENLPGYLAINISHNQDSTGNERGNIEGHTNADMTPIPTTLQTEVSKKKEKRSRSKKDKEGWIKDRPVANEKLIMVNSEIASTSTIDNSESIKTCNMPNNNPSASKVVLPTRNGKYDWYAMLPSLETLRNREHLRSKPSSDQRKSYIMNVLGRKVLALPYVDIGLPDFLEYNYPKPERFYAEENFLYGAPRPN